MCGILVLPKSVGREAVEKSLAKIRHRGPDAVQIQLEQDYYFGFNRLSIMDLSNSGNQPFNSNSHILVCNGEIYNHRKLKNNYKFAYQSESDCEVLLPMLQLHDIKTLSDKLDAEYSMVALNKKSNEIVASRDPLGIRPLFYGYHEGKICFASEAKCLIDICDKIETFPPGYIYRDGKFEQYSFLTRERVDYCTDMHEILKGIRETLVEGTLKRLDSDAPIGFLLSGGLDSSLVCSIAQKHLDNPIKTFAIGLDYKPIDLAYAKVVADYLGTDHTEVIFTNDDIFKNLRELIYTLETWDITTIRAAMGMYLISKYIRENTDIKVLMTGEVSDELFGYKYTDFAPTPEEFQKEAKKRIDEIYMYDVLRADRTISAHAIEARVPFSDKYFVDFVMSIDPKIKMNSTGVGKHLLRRAFEDGEEYLPKDILYREKAAFSDAVGHGLVDELKAAAERMYTDDVFDKKVAQYDFSAPVSKEALMYREIFRELFPQQDHLIKSYWLPNQTWDNCNVTDPSARALPNYGNSGSGGEELKSKKEKIRA